MWNRLTAPEMRSRPFLIPLWLVGGYAVYAAFSEGVPVLGWVVIALLLVSITTTFLVLLGSDDEA